MGEASKLLAQLVDVPPLHSLTQFAADMGAIEMVWMQKSGYVLTPHKTLLWFPDPGHFPLPCVVTPFPVLLHLCPGSYSSCLLVCQPHWPLVCSSNTKPMHLRTMLHGIEILLLMYVPAQCLIFKYPCCLLFFVFNTMAVHCLRYHMLYLHNPIYSPCSVPSFSTPESQLYMVGIFTYSHLTLPRVKDELQEPQGCLCLFCYWCGKVDRALKRAGQGCWFWLM